MAYQPQSGTLMQQVWDFCLAKETADIDDLCQAFPHLPSKALREALGRLRIGGWIESIPMKTIYVVPRGTQRPIETRGGFRIKGEKQNAE